MKGIAPRIGDFALLACSFVTVSCELTTTERNTERNSKLWRPKLEHSRKCCCRFE